MTENEKRLAGEIYDPSDEEIQTIQQERIELMDQFNSLGNSQKNFTERQELIQKMFGRVGENCYIESPFHANWGGRNFYLGDNVYINFNLTLVDDVDIIVGDNVMIAPNVTITTANHPLDPSKRRKGLQYAKKVIIENNVWLGAGVIIMPGVTIGENTIIGAGSIVTKNIPSNVVAVGNPCRVIKTIK